MLYHLLQAYEEDFAKLFKVKADFDTEVVRSERQDRQYARFIAKLCREEGLPHFGVDAVAEVIRQGFRFADRHDRLSCASVWLATSSGKPATGPERRPCVRHTRGR